MRRGLWALAIAASMAAQEGTGVLEGSVIDAITGAPVEGASVVLLSERGAPAKVRPQRTDAGGRFRFEQLPPGDYGVSSRANGYLEAMPRSSAEFYAAGAVAKPVTVRLTPAAILEGRVLDESRLPVEGVRIYARLQGAPSAISTTSNADGVFRIEHMTPGSYKLLAKVPLAVRRASAAVDKETGERWALSDLHYYPGVERVDEASVVHAEAGTHVTGVDIRLRKSRPVDFTVRLHDAVTREPSRGVKVELESADNEFRDEAYDCAPLDEKGTRKFELISPGRYNVLAYAGECRVDLPYEVAVDVNARDGRERDIAVPRPAPIEGVIRTPDNAPLPPGSLLLRIDRRASANRPLEVELKNEKRFRVEGVPPGVRTIYVAFTAKLPPEWYVASVRLGAQQAIDGPVTVSEGGNPPLEIELAEGAASVTVQITGNRWPPPFASVRRADGRPGGWRPTSGWVFPDGSYRATGLPPGEYVVALQEGPAPGCRTDRVTVRLARGESRTVALQRCVK